jgi:tRNA A37 threonylcarbamoyladenosine dehydratase
MSEEHRFSRTELLLGANGLNRLARASVTVFGLGGVGSYAVEALVRGGVGTLTLVDFDVIGVTNLNRQLHALETTVGRPKAEVMAERCRLINPAASIKALTLPYSADNADILLDARVDFVLDCIDQITAKLHLLQTCKARGLRVISSMGAANKVDPTQIAIADLFQTDRCRLARIMRKELRRRGVGAPLPVVFSTEEFRPLVAGRRTVVDEGGGYQERRAPLGSSAWIPPLFGLTMAAYVLRRLLADETAT